MNYSNMICTTSTDWTMYNVRKKHVKLANMSIKGGTAHVILPTIGP